AGHRRGQPTAPGSPVVVAPPGEPLTLPRFDYLAVEQGCAGPAGLRRPGLDRECRSVRPEGDAEPQVKVAALRRASLVESGADNTGGPLAKAGATHHPTI